MARPRPRRIRHPRIHRLVQPPKTPRTHRKHPTRRKGGQPLQSTNTNNHRNTHTKHSPINTGRFKQTLLLHCGTFLVEWTPKRFWVQPKDLTGEKLAEWNAERAKYRWTPISKPDKNGAIRFICPQCDGRIRTNAKTRIRRKTNPRRNAPYVATIDKKHCCQGTITIPVEKLDTYQHIPYGTPAWKKSYGRRLQIENLNSLVKNDGGLKDGWCRALGEAAHNFGLLALLIAHNLRQPNNFDHEYQPHGEQPPTPTRERPPSKPTANGLTTRGPPP